MENPMKLDDLGVPLFPETTMFELCKYHPNPHVSHIYRIAPFTARILGSANSGKLGEIPNEMDV